jgi:hypothetical protein
VHPEVVKAIERWRKADLIDRPTAARIEAFEASRAPDGGARWPVIVAFGFGGILLAAGVLLFVAARWELLSPAGRFAIALAMTGAFHAAGAVAPAAPSGIRTSLHAVGSVALGAGIFLAGQIFNMEEHWPGGLMLWTLGVAASWGLLKSWPQAALTAALAPAWLASEWIVAVDPRHWVGGSVLATGLLLTAAAYLAARRRADDTPDRRALAWIGGMSLLPLGFGAAIARGTESASVVLLAAGWIVAAGAPIVLAWALRGREAWPMAPAALWTIVLTTMAKGAWTPDRTAIGWWWDAAGVYLWCAAGAVGLVAWGLADRRTERVNLGVAGFALTVLAFYFTDVMDALNRSAGLLALGALFLVGGWLLERARRQLIARVRPA